MKTTSQSRQDIPHHTPCSVQEGQTFRISKRGCVECKSEVGPFPKAKLNVVGKIACFFSLSEVDTWPVALYGQEEN